MSEDRKRRHDGPRSTHDVGGLDFGPVDRHEHDATLHERRVDALYQLLAGPKRAAFRVDALRRVIEDSAPADYDSTAYYDRWIKAIATLLIEQDVLSRDEIMARMEAIAARHMAEGREVSPERAL